MKRILSIAILMAVCAISAQAQLEVKETGQIIIGTNYGNTNKLQIGSQVDSLAGVTIGNVGRKTTMSIHRLSNDTTSTGIYVKTENNTGTNLGIHSIVNSHGNYYKNTPNIALKGESTGAKYSIGVYGEAILEYEDSVMDHCGAGIYGTSVNQDTISFYYHGRYAGYFNGKVRVAGGPLFANLLSPSLYYSTGGTTQNAGATLLSADRNESVTEKLSQVGAIQFMRDKRDTGEAAGDMPSEELGRMAAKGIDVNALEKEKRAEEPTLSAIQYGLAADQLKKVYPELVYEDSEGNVSINYIEMIPLLVQSINELSQKVATLEGGNAVKAKAQSTAIEETVEDIDQVRMDQNKPNPFSGSTVITLNVPETVKQASIFIYDLSGKQIQSLPVTERGETDITVYASGLSAGMYIYTLVVDGQVKVTRKMIVTE